MPLALVYLGCGLSRRDIAVVMPASMFREYKNTLKICWFVYHGIYQRHRDCGHWEAQGILVAPAPADITHRTENTSGSTAPGTNRPDTTYSGAATHGRTWTHRYTYRKGRQKHTRQRRSFSVISSTISSQLHCYICHLYF